MTGSGDATGAETVVEFEAWCAASPEPDGLDASVAAACLADLFSRARRGGGDLRDPDEALLRWITRDLARDDDLLRDEESDDLEDNEYLLAIRTLMRFLLFLRANGRWRRSERAVRDCWSVFDWATHEPLGVPSLGGMVNTILAAGLAETPSPSGITAAVRGTALVPALRATLDAVAERPLTSGAVAELAGLTGGPTSVGVWVDGLSLANLVRVDTETGEVSASSAVRETRGCPPVDSILERRVVAGLVQAALRWGFEADVDEQPDRLTFPRGTAMMAAVAVSCDETGYFADEGEGADDETTTAELVRMFVAKMIGGRNPAAPGVTGEVVSVLAVLTAFGLLEERRLPLSGGGYLASPDALHHPILQAVGDVMGCSGDTDEHSGWSPVERIHDQGESSAVEIHLELEPAVEGTSADGAWRTVRANSSASLHRLHESIESSFGWRGVRRHVFLDAQGVRRFTAPSLLRRFEEAGDERIVDSRAVALGSVLTEPGDELLYEYGESGGVQRVRVRVDAVVSDPVVSVEERSRAGDRTAEQTLLGEVLSRRLPPGLTIPDELERAWAFMEESGWWAIGRGDHLLAPCSFAAVPGIVFSSGCTLDGWFRPDSTAAEQLLPIAMTDGTGSTAALWFERTGEVRVVELGSEGEAHLLAETVPDFLRLCAIGYSELTSLFLGGPVDADAADAVAVFRSWVEDTFGVPVPAPGSWPELTDDRFTEWVEDRLREDAP